MSISVDAQILIWGIKKQATENRRDMIPRAEHFFRRCQERREQLILTSQALAEFLVGYSADQMRASLVVVSRTFIIAPFDAKAAVIAAELQSNWKQLRDDHGGTKQTIKADISVLASSIAIGADYLYTEDPQIGTIAKGRIIVRPLPPIETQSGLFGHEAF